MEIQAIAEFLQHVALAQSGVSRELFEQGLLGVLVVALGGFALWTHQRVVKRADRLEEENQRVRDRVEDKVIPLVQRAITAIERSNHQPRTREDDEH